MTKLSAIAPSSSPALTDYFVGVTGGNVDDRVTLQSLLTLFYASGDWWQELGRNTLVAGGNVLSVSFTPKKYLTVILSTLPTGGSVDTSMRFNGDTAANYSYRNSDNGGADSTAVSQTNYLVSGSVAVPYFVIGEIINISNQEKVGHFDRLTNAVAGAATAPSRSEHAMKWVNTSAQINLITVSNLAGAGQFGILSELIVLGHD